MLRFGRVFALLAVLACSVFADSVVTLTDDSIEEFVSKTKVVLVKFYAPWCGHCKSLAPKYEEAAELVKDEADIAIAKVDATENSNMAQSLGVQGYPTLTLFVDGEPIAEYNGARVAADIAQYVRDARDGKIEPQEEDEMEEEDDESEDGEPEGSLVVSLTDETIGAFLEETPLALIEFYATWCGHCKMLKPAYTEAADLLKDVEGVKIAKIEATQNTAGQEFGIEGFPTIKLFRNGKPVDDYSGDRSAEAIASYVRRQAGPAVVPVAAQADLDAFLENSESKVLGCISGDAAAETAFFTALAEELRSTFLFSLVSDAALMTAADCKDKTALVYSADGSAVIDLVGKAVSEEDKTELEATAKAVRVNSLPVLGALGPDTFMMYTGAEVPLLLVFTKEADRTAEELVKGLASDLRTAHGVVSTLVDADQFGEFATELGLKDGDMGLALLDYDNEQHFLFGDRESTAEQVSAFVTDFKDGKLSPHMKSEEAPETNDGPVKIVVGTTFSEIVEDASKDVLIKFYAPWCSHCQRLAPVFEKVATYLADQTDIVVAKMDVTANDPPKKDEFAIEGIPTLKLVKKDGSVVDLEDSRELRGILEFVAREATTPFEVPEIAAEDEKNDEEMDFASMFGDMEGFDPSMFEGLDLGDLDLGDLGQMMGDEDYSESGEDAADAEPAAPVHQEL